jgi:hypothetical protein
VGPIPVADLAFPALWLFLLGLLLSLGVWRMRRARLDVRDDWARLVRFHDVLTAVEASRGRNEPARVELIALARALDAHVEAPAGRPGLAAQAVRFDPGAADGIDPRDAEALAAALRRDVLGADRAIQARMKETARSSGRFVPVFFSGVGAVLVLPLVVARHLGLVRRLTARRVEQGLWFHAALGVVVFVVLAGTVFAAIRVARVVGRMVEEGVTFGS